MKKILIILCLYNLCNFVQSTAMTPIIAAQIASPFYYYKKAQNKQNEYGRDALDAYKWGYVAGIGLPFTAALTVVMAPIGLMMNLKYPSIEESPATKRLHRAQSIAGLVGFCSGASLYAIPFLRKR